MAKILRPVALAISAAVASSGSLRRAQMATSTPSRAKANAIALPMPSLAPVTIAFFPVIARSIAASPLDWRGGGPRVPAIIVYLCPDRYRLRGETAAGAARVISSRIDSRCRKKGRRERSFEKLAEVAHRKARPRAGARSRCLRGPLRACRPASRAGRLRGGQSGLSRITAAPADRFRRVERFRQSRPQGRIQRRGALAVRRGGAPPSRQP